MPNRKLEKRRRKLRVHGPSADAVGAPPTGRKAAPRPAAGSSPKSKQRRELAIPSLKRSARKGGIMLALLVAVVVITSRNQSTGSLIFTGLVFVACIPLFVLFDLWVARKVYKRVTGVEAPR